MTDGADGNKRIKRVAVFCASRDGYNPVYKQAATELGTLLGKNNYDVVYGGGDMGLMGAVSRAARNAGSFIKGIILEAWREASGAPPPEGTIEIVADTLAQRKTQMIDGSEATLILPGGFGTYDELWETVALQDMQRYRAPDELPRPIVLLNTNGFYDDVKKHVSKAVSEGFIYPASENLVHFADTPAEAIEIINKINNLPRRAILPAPPSP